MKYLLSALALTLLLLSLSFFYLSFSTGNEGVILNLGRPIVIKMGNSSKVLLWGEMAKGNVEVEKWK